MSILYSSLVLGSKPKAYYRLNESSGTVASDASGNSNTGTYTGVGVTYSVTGAVINDANKAVTLNGTSGDMACPAAVDPSTFTALTIECWVKLSTLTLSTSPALFANEVVGASHKGVVLFFNSTATALNFLLGNGTTATTCTGSFTFATGTWYHLAATWDGSTMTVYVNGVSKGTASFTGPIASSTNNLTLGHNPGGTDFFTGSVDEFAVYPSSLPVTTLLEHYNVANQAQGGAGLYLITQGSTLLAQDVNQALAILQQPAGGQEAGKYQVAGPSYAVGAFIGVYIGSLSRVSAPVSVSIDTADVAPASINAPSTVNLTSSGFGVIANSTAIAPSGNAAGNYTISY